MPPTKTVLDVPDREAYAIMLEWAELMLHVSRDKWREPFLAYLLGMIVLELDRLHRFFDTSSTSRQLPKKAECQSLPDFARLRAS